MSLSDSEWTSITSAASALAAIAAAAAAFWSARVARDTANQAAQQARAATLNDLSGSVTKVLSRGERLRGLVTRLKVARQTHCGLLGRNVSAATPLLQADEEKGGLAEQMMADARALEMSSFDQCADEELQAHARYMRSHAIRLEIMETDLHGDLERVEAENREARARRA